jgi:hypothetical protein
MEISFAQLHVVMSVSLFSFAVVFYLPCKKHSGLLHVHTRADGEMNEMKARDGTKFSFLTMGPPFAMTGISLSGFSICCLGCSLEVVGGCLTSKTTHLLFPNLTHKIEIGTAKGGTLLLATSNQPRPVKLSNQSTAGLRLCMPFASIASCAKMLGQYDFR